MIKGEELPEEDGAWQHVLGVFVRLIADTQMKGCRSHVPLCTSVLAWVCLPVCPCLSVFACLVVSVHSSMFAASVCFYRFVGLYLSAYLFASACLVRMFAFFVLKETDRYDQENPSIRRLQKD